MDINTFINSLNVKNGFAEVLIRTEEDFQDFYVNFFNRNNNVIDDLMDFREYKLHTSMIGFKEFEKMCNNDIKTAFEKTFLQPISYLDAGLIKEMVACGRVSLDYIYNDFEKNINKNVLKNVL